MVALMNATQSQQSRRRNNRHGSGRTQACATKPLLEMEGEGAPAGAPASAEVTIKLPETVPIRCAELEAIERHLHALLDELLV
jgi:hypothetical protein